MSERDRLVAEHEKRIDLTYTSLPIIVVVSLILFVAWSAYIITDERARIDKRLDRLSTAIAQIASAVQDVTAILSDKLGETVTVDDLRYFCADLKDANPKLGLECPATSVRTFGLRSQTTKGASELTAAGRKLGKVRDATTDVEHDLDGK
jgi:hypothetical protein